MSSNNKNLYPLDLALFEKKINYSFSKKELLITALTHSSYINEKKNKLNKYNERLEFLGDSVLGLIITEYLYKSFTYLSEGNLTVIRSKIVCEKGLAKCATELGFGEFLLLGKGEEMTGGRLRNSILSDAFEAVIAAIYLDGGLERARNFILPNMNTLITNSVEGTVSIDYKTRLQEMLQKNGEYNIVYAVIDESGPAHDKIFITEVRINGEVNGQGTGKSKKESEQKAAKNALIKFGK